MPVLWGKGKEDTGTRKPHLTTQNADRLSLAGALALFARQRSGVASLKVMLAENPTRTRKGPGVRAPGPARLWILAQAKATDPSRQLLAGGL